MKHLNDHSITLNITGKNNLIFSLIKLFLLSFYCLPSSASVHHFINYSQELENPSIRSITKDHNGIMWFGTLKGLYQFNGYNFEKIITQTKLDNAYIRVLFEDNDKNLWAGTHENGLFKLEANRWSQLTLQKQDLKEFPITSIFESSNGNLWVATTAGLFSITSSVDKNLAVRIKKFEKDKITSAIKLNSETILLATKGQIIQYNINSDTTLEINLANDYSYIHALYLDDKMNLWIGTTKSYYKYNFTKKSFADLPLIPLPTIVMSITGDSNNIWLLTLTDGLYRFDIQSESIAPIINGYQNTNSENALFTQYLDGNNLWIGTFYDGVDKLEIKSTIFKFETNMTGSIDCAQNSLFRSLIIDQNNNKWIGSNNALIQFNKDDGICKLFPISKYQKNNTFNPIFNLSIQENILWLSTSGGVKKFNINSETFLETPALISDIYTYFTTNPIKNKIYIGTTIGLFQFDIDSNKTTQFKSVSFNNSKFLGYTEYKNSGIIFTTSDGLASFNINGDLVHFLPKNNEYQQTQAEAIAIDKDELLYLAIEDIGLVIFNKEGDIVQRYNAIHGLSEKYSIRNINIHNDDIWLATNNGLLKLNKINSELHTYIKEDGTGITNYFKSSLVDNTGEIYFVGKNGLVHFNPDAIKLSKFDSPIILSKFMLINQAVKDREKTETGFVLEKPIDELEEIELGHNDYIIGFEFASLDYADPMRNQYAYRLKGLNDDWVYVDAHERKATFTNLKSGNYIFQVKASNKDGVWSDHPKQLKIKVHPAPWLSPWAYFIYFITTVFSMWAFIRYRTIASRKRAQELEVTVVERTQEVTLQKKMVESLLDHKNEVLANITHEFKTPLALILGPTEQLSQQIDLNKHSNHINMIQRNANRLILMVSQILKLSQAEQHKQVIRESQAVHPTLVMLYESFVLLARNKNIKLTIDNQQHVNVYATSECLAIVIGNLLSNALKFTNAGGEIKIESKVKNHLVSITIEDSGTGIQENDLDKIFTRFTRLDNHKGIQGTGLGLSVTKEITEANNGHIKLISQWGKGSKFTVTFPVSNIENKNQNEDEVDTSIIEQLSLNTENEISNDSTIITKYPFIKNRTTVLIIEDNQDMQQHIGNVLKAKFNCLISDRGKDGIALALLKMPDLVICDVMMPGMDGYQVTRILRHDKNTSHIPIILLTALNTKESRIKGWRENIDVYVTKPFDATELIIQIENILTIRKFIQDKTNKAITSNTPLASLDLPKIDLIFVQKLKDVICKYYSNQYFQIADIASKMHIGERQLQRKVKALINQSPIDLLRQYRLEKAAIKLKDGYQVGIVGDECGFNSSSYFTSCFKNKYGLTPKKYQLLNNKNRNI